MADDRQALIGKLEANIQSVFFGRERTVRHAVIALLAAEHLLLEDVPGVGKTLLGKAISKSVAGQFGRIQFTPDLMPTDITGCSIFNPDSREFQFCEGPIFANIVLADEINRATPRTQSAMLEAMSERQVSIDRHTDPLPCPFMVIATQNPAEFEGTYPLPENQLDRFLIRTSIGYPPREAERTILESHRTGEPVDRLGPVLDCSQVESLQQAVREVSVEPSLADYLLDIVEATRTSHHLSVGVSPRGALALYRAAQASALADGRAFVVPDDIKSLAVPVLAHRIVAKGFDQGSRREAVEALVAQLVDEVTIPA